MTKIIEIERCGFCPYRKFKVGEFMQMETCEKANMGMRDADIEAMNTTGFPEWCPLKDAKVDGCNGPQITSPLSDPSFVQMIHDCN
ncbi:MAG: hypothetical protein PHW73_10335 [Atribacterota bacterium]|nr:hypothetical protein [Atribacterota bacterium]